MTAVEATMMLKQWFGDAEAKRQKSNRPVRNPRTAEAGSRDSRSDEKGGGSLDETTSKSHRMAGVRAKGISSNHSRGARSSAESKSDEAETWIDQQRDRH